MSQLDNPTILDYKRQYLISCSTLSSLDIYLHLQWKRNSVEAKHPFISTLAAEKSSNVDPTSLNKGQASKKINRLKNLDTKGADATVDELV